jgi:hypothetical protein
MSYVLELEIPGLPKRTNNAQANWRAKYAEAKKWKRLVLNAVVFARKQPKAPCQKAQVTLTRHSSVRPDFDGLVSSFKHVIDGLILAKVIVNDNHDVIGVPEYLWEKAPPKLGRITIKVEAA